MAVILAPAEIRELLDMPRAMQLVQGSLEDLARGAGQNPLRRGMLIGESRQGEPRAVLGLMPGALTGAAGHPAALGLKVVSVMPGNHATDWDAHQGVVVLLDPETGVPAAVLDASEITAIRTAAASGVATRALAREDAGDLALIGSGVEARTHLDAMAAARELRRVRVFSRDGGRCAAFARREAARTGLPIEAVASAEEAVRDADIVCTVTTASEPVVFGSWLAPGAHINAVGACMPKARELDAEALRRARLYCDSRESLFAEAGDFLLARAEGAVHDEHLVGELGEVLVESLPGRGGDDEITLFESLGIAVWDLAVAEWVAAEARRRGVGVEVALGGKRHA